MKTNKPTLFNLIILIAIIVFLNLVSLTLFSRFDLSKGHVYSLSKASKETVRVLEDRLVVKAYFSKNLPGEYADAYRYTRDLLSEYQAYSRGKLRFEFIDPTNEENLKEEARKNQISPVQMRVVENDKLEIREVYMGLVFLYQNKTEAIPLIQNTRGLEYDITSTVKKITAQGMKKLAFFQTEPPPPQNIPGMPPQQEEFGTVRQMLSESYEVNVIDLTQPVTDDVDVLFFTGIKDSLSYDQLYNLDSYITSGGNVLFYQDRINADIQNQTAKPIDSNLFDLLRSYGINIKSNIVADAQCGQVQIQRMQGIFRVMTPVFYPFFPIINNVNKDNLIVKNLDQMQLIFTSEIDTTKIAEGIEFEPLLFTSASSGEVKAPRFDISVNQFMNANLGQMFIDPPKIVSGIYTGSFPSFFKTGEEDEIIDSPVARILVLPDREFIEDAGAVSVPGNLDFVLNSVDYMASESTLIEIRSRETEYKPLRELSNPVRKTVKWLNILIYELKKEIKRPFKYEEMRFLPKSFSGNPSVICIYGNKVVNFLLGENMFAFVIESKELAENYKKYHEYLWENVAKSKLLQELQHLSCVVCVPFLVSFDLTENLLYLFVICSLDNAGVHVSGHLFCTKQILKKFLNCLNSHIHHS